MCGGDQSQLASEHYTTPKSLKPVDKEKAKNGDLVVEEFPITFEGYTYKYGRIAYVKGRDPRPVILVHHNYCGLKQFDVDQACFMARLGYVGLAVDLYQETPSFTCYDRARVSGRPVDRDAFHACAKEENLLQRSPAEYSTQELDFFFHAMPKVQEGKVDFQLVRNFVGGFIQMRRLLCNPKAWRELMKMNLEKAFKHPAVKHGLAGAFGYCLGGQSCLEQVRAGHPIQAMCSFHGLLHSRPTTEAEPFNSHKRMPKDEYASKIAVANNYNKECRVLIENGDKDGEVPPDTIVDFVAEMDAQLIDWRFNNHARGPHGFALGKGVPGCEYQEHIDRRSSISMLNLLAETWPEYEQHRVECNASGTNLTARLPPKRVVTQLFPWTVGAFVAGALVSATAISLLKRLQ